MAAPFDRSRRRPRRHDPPPKAWIRWRTFLRGALLLRRWRSLVAGRGFLGRPRRGPSAYAGTRAASEPSGTPDSMARAPPSTSIVSETHGEFGARRRCSTRGCGELHERRARSRRPNRAGSGRNVKLTPSSESSNTFLVLRRLLLPLRWRLRWLGDASSSTFIRLSAEGLRRRRRLKSRFDRRRDELGHDQGYSDSNHKAGH